MLKAKDIMTKEPVTVAPETDVVAAARILLHRGFNGLPVVDDNGRLLGVICQSDLIAQQKSLKLPSVFTVLDGLLPLSSPDRLEREMQKITATTVADAMTQDPVSVDPETTLEDIASLMVDRKYHTLPVVKDGRLLGVIGKEDLLRTLVPR